MTETQSSEAPGEPPAPAEPAPLTRHSGEGAASALQTLQVLEGRDPPAPGADAPVPPAPAGGAPAP